MEDSQDLSSKKASLTAGIIGAVMVVLVCFAAAFLFSEAADEQVSPQLRTTSSSVEAE